MEVKYFSKQIKSKQKRPTVNQKRRLLELFELRVDMVAKNQVKICGAITKGLIVELSSGF